MIEVTHKDNMWDKKRVEDQENSQFKPLHGRRGGRIVNTNLYMVEEER